ncbi:hypothetical protein AU074_13970 [Pseudomonas sp. ATCC PTA-122608]|uniref:hypothetical protein n=1 Tax=Pseudomonas sp. ATCC PTA-122608 TaxID=1771311 RepID=UPI00096BA200|nr:hypothetical protein [Pseudomonas sp. ATCC PTA-122608]OLY72278.1 hypothetical protein AU074_13970 [Pseudomonas sp. ATCC PTA-122608]
MNTINRYLDCLTKLYKLPSYSPALIEEFLKLVDADGIIELTKWRKENIAEAIGINVYTINNALQVYKAKKIVNWEAVSVFTLNKELFGSIFNNAYDDGFPEFEVVFCRIIACNNSIDKVVIRKVGAI